MPYSKYSPKQKRLAAVTAPRKKVTQAHIIAVKRKNKKPKPPDLTNPRSKKNIQKPVYRGNPNARFNKKDYWTT